ncbi:MAG: hypothetical protein LBT40_11585 [Deltaproteobacteria bacterium]|nr:hypothetical protein [Deltaproteobacteria bacterium]
MEDATSVEDAPAREVGLAREGVWWREHRPASVEVPESPRLGAAKLQAGPAGPPRASSLATCRSVEALLRPPVIAPGVD